jgi:cellulose/xylan binding protein with CBM9 domain
LKVEDMGCKDRIFPLVGLIILAMFSVNAAMAAEKTIRALSIEDNIEMDGHLDESVWAKTQVIDDFVQQEPNEGEPISERTEVRLLYDSEKLYISFECYDSQPDKVIANEMRRDGELWQNDNVYLLLDTYGDRRRGFFFRTNALGAQSDSAVTDCGQNISDSWDCIWECAGRRHDKGWTVEMAIPFSQLRFNESEEMLWGVNFGRNITHKHESAQWIKVPRSESWGGFPEFIFEMGKLFDHES